MDEILLIFVFNYAAKAANLIYLIKASILSMLENAKLKFSFLKLGMAGEFTERAEKLGLFNLGDLMSVNLAKLKAHRDFNYIWYAEMLSMLKSQGLLHEFQKRTLEA